MSFEIQVLEAFQTWRDAALQRHPLEALPTGEELVAAARDHTELEPGGEFPALLVWADALKKVRALALTDNTDVIPVSEDLYEPNLDPFPGRTAAPETTEPEQAEEYLEPEEEYAETVVDDLWASVATPTPTPVQEDYLDEESHPAEATAEEPELAETWDLTQFEEPARDRDTSPETDPDERHYQPHEFRMLDGFADVEPIPGANLWLEETAAGAIALNWSLPEESYSFGAATRLFRVVSDEVEFELDPELGEPRAVTVGTRWVDTADLTTAYVTSAPKTFVLKLCIGLITGFVAHKVFKISQENHSKKHTTIATVLSCTAGMAFNVVADPLVGYFYKMYIMGVPQKAADAWAKMGAATTLVNAIIAVIAASILYAALRPALKRANLFPTL